MNYVGIWLYRLLIAALLAVCIAYSFHEEWNYEQQVALTGYTGRNNEKRTTVILISPWLLPLVLVVPCLTMLLLLGPVVSAITLVQFSFQLIVVLTLYFGVLLAVLPLLHRKISARACATLWLLPVFFYYVIGLSDKIYLPPLVVLRIPPNAAPLLVQIWLIGAVAVVIWHILSHVWFRRRILKDARPIKEEAVVDLWWTEQRQALLKWHIRLVTSPAVSSPLTIGLFNKTMVTVLPEHTYTLDQYRLIFRHELRHVQRRDVDTKCFYLFCKALCWFNPLMWIALRKASADLELSCDEMVVYGAEDKTRREYASLLLETAGDSRGFSTCLSASANSLRHRLRGVVAPRERAPGTKLLAVVMVVLVLCSGIVGVSGTYGTLEDVVLAPYGQNHTVNSITVTVDNTQYYLGDPSPQVSEELLDYLSALPVTRLAMGQEVWQNTGRHASFFLTGYNYHLQLTDGLCSLKQLGVRATYPVLYRLETPIDWAYLQTILAENGG